MATTTSLFRRFVQRFSWHEIKREPHASGRTVVTSTKGKTVRVQMQD